jgi:5-methylcytosine-specific restriction endonuclease McrA
VTRRKKNKKVKTTAPSGDDRRFTVLKIVRTDSTFVFHTTSEGDEIWIGKCIHCNRRLVVGSDGQTGFTIEHIVPRVADGSNDLRNLALACGDCNNEKGRRHDEHVGKGGHADQVVTSLWEKRQARWRNDDDQRIKTW